MQSSTSFFQEAGIFAVSCIKELRHESKNKLAICAQMPRNIIHSENFKEQKVEPLVSKKVAAMLEDELIIKVKDLNEFIRALIEHVTQLLLTANLLKSKKKKQFRCVLQMTLS